MLCYRCSGDYSVDSIGFGMLFGAITHSIANRSESTQCEPKVRLADCKVWY
jgi:hypothetical protein